MKYRFTFFLFFCAVARVLAQPINLVPNGGFEERDLCIFNDSYIEDCYPWFNPGNHGNALILGGTPDLFHACAVVNEEPCPYPGQTYLDPWFAGVPTNALGCEEPYEGNGYAGAFFFFPNVDQQLDGWREYLAVRLTEPMQAGVTYDVSMQVSLAERMTHAIWNFQVLFSPDSLLQVTTQYMDYEPQLNGILGDYIVNKVGWRELSWNYTAKGGEGFMYIGNFQPNSETDTLFVNEGNTDGHYGGAYYYIDDVIVSYDALSARASLDFEGIVWPNPTDGLFHYNGNRATTFQIFNLQGRLLLEGNNVASTSQFDLTPYGQGMYLLKVQDFNGNFKVLKVIKR